MKILQLERELATAGARQSAMEDRLQTTENRLGVIEGQFLGILIRLGGTTIGGDALNPIIHPGPARPTPNYNFVGDALVTPTIAKSGFHIYQIGSSQSFSSESRLGIGMSYDPVDPSFGLASRDI